MANINLTENNLHLDERRELARRDRVDSVHSQTVGALLALPVNKEMNMTQLSAAQSDSRNRERNERSRRMHRYVDLTED